MHAWNGKYVIIEDELAAARPAMLVVSAVADTLQAARAISNVEGNPKALVKTAFDAEEVGKTLVLRLTAEARRPQRAAIFRLKALNVHDTVAVNDIELDLFQGEKIPEEPRADAGDERPDFLEHFLLSQAGVAVTDRKAYAELNMFGFLGSAALASGDAATAEKHFRDAVELAKRIDHPASIVKAYGSLGSAMSQLGKGEKAIEFLNEALAIARQNQLDEEEGQTLANLAEAYAAAGDRDRAIGLHAERCALAARVGDLRGYAFSTANIGITHYEMGNYDEALKFLEAAAEVFRAQEGVSELGRAQAYIRAAKMYRRFAKLRKLFTGR